MLKMSISCDVRVHVPPPGKMTTFSFVTLFPKKPESDRPVPDTRYFGEDLSYSVGFS